jgi:NAD(P)-dependent dehydrogenase (short-subunit alcohol dehydrogenase family)
MTPGKLDGKVAFVTGAASGMGREVARRFADEGASVFGTDRNAAGVAETAEMIAADGGRADHLELDVTDAAAVTDAVGRCAASFGRLDILFTAAGITGEFAETVHCSDDNWALTIAINLTGTFNCARAALSEMLRGDGGAIVTVASAGGGVRPFPRLPAYCASKAGVVGFTKAMALEYAPHGIRVNCIAPGATDTPMMQGSDRDPLVRARVHSNPIGRWATTAEIAATAMYLVDPAASGVTGIVVPVDGGSTA